MRLTVGCPVRDRAWCLDSWFDHVEESCVRAGVLPGYAFVAGASYDDTDKILYKRTRGRKTELIKISDPGLPSGVDRSWTEDRMYFMVDVRNQLLGLVRNTEPDLFLSLDSDILVHPDTVSNLIETAADYDATAGRTYLHAIEKTVNWGDWIKPDQRMRRGHDLTCIRKVGIIMAIKMMNPSAYNIDYQYHFRGEDLGWSWACGQAGLTLAVDGRNINKHCLNERMFNRIDERVGY